jgi:hypothetical protein
MELQPQLTDKPAWRCRSASQLPIEWITQILSFLSVADKIVCRSVCKKWFVAAKHALEDEEELSLSLGRIRDCYYFNGYYDDDGFAISCDCFWYDLPNAMHFVSDLKTAAGIDPHVEKMLSHFKRLKKLTSSIDLNLRCYTFSRNTHALSEAAYPILQSLLFANSHHLTSLDMPDASLNQGFFPVLENLRELRCESLRMIDCSMFPKLQKLTVRFNSRLEHLPIDSMQELNLITAYNMENIVKVVSRLVNLKALRIGHSSSWKPDETNSFKKKLIANLQNLTRLSLRFAIRANPADDDDDLMAHLVEKFPQLMEINCMDLTEKGIRLLASLKGLQIATDLRIASHDDIIPMLMHILTGNSQDSIQKVSIRVKRAGGGNEIGMRNPVIQIRVSDHLQDNGLPFIVTSDGDGYVLFITRDPVTEPLSPFTTFQVHSQVNDREFYSQFD